MPFKIVRNDITKMNTEAIVNTANEDPTFGTGCDYAVYMAAGQEKLLKYRQENIGFVPEGEVFITPGFNLKAKYIIHAVSPLYLDGDEEEENLLRSCYRKSLLLARENGIRSISFPLISTGGFGYPKEEGIRVAVDEINAFLLDNDMDIFLVVFDEKSTTLGEKLYPNLQAYIDNNYVDVAKEQEYDDILPAHIEAPRPARGLFNSIFRGGRDKSAVSAELSEVEYCREVREAECYKPMESSKPVESSKPAESYKEAVFDFEEEHESKLKERMSHLSDTYSEYLMYLIQNKNMENAEVYKRAIVDKKIFSKIKNNINYHPNKMTALCLCVGAKLNLDETKDLLARAGYALSPCDKTDIIFSYFIENAIYDMIELDIQLEEHGLPCIIS